MALLASASYDPAVAVTKATSSLLAMTALDTTNLRVTFTAPANGNVLVRMKGLVTGATTAPRVLLGVLEGATLRGRACPGGGVAGGLATTLVCSEASYLVTGLTSGNSYTWDAAYGVDVLAVSSNLKYGGPNDATGADAFGAHVFEVWSVPNLLAGTFYDPTTSATIATTSLSAMAAMDTTNLRLTFTAPTSGKVLWRLRTQFHGSTTVGEYLLGVMEGATVVSRVAPIHLNPTAASAASTCFILESAGVVTGVSAGSHTWDAAFATQVIAGAGGLKHGGPNDTTTNNCFGGTAFEVWQAA